MSTEHLKKQIEMLLCPWHLQHPIVEAGVAGELIIKACCDEFEKEIFEKMDDQLLGGISSGTV